jgi:hypothetical protein
MMTAVAANERMRGVRKTLPQRVDAMLKFSSRHPFRLPVGRPDQQCRMHRVHG